MKRTVGTVWGLKVRSKTLALLFLALGLSCPAHAETFSGSTQVAIVTPLSLINTDTLRFGSIIAGTTAGTVTIDPFTEGRITTGGATAYGGAVSAGKFTGASDGTSHLKIDVPVGSITLTRIGGGATMLVDNFTINGNKNNWVPGGTIYTFNVGARLRVNANQMAGTYTGTYNVTVNYR